MHRFLLLRIILCEIADELACQSARIGGDTMTTFEVLSLMIAFGILVATIIIATIIIASK